MLVKICGLTRPEEAGYLNEAGADMAGFVLFFPKSRRCVSIEQATAIMEKLDRNIKRVAVMVSPGPDEVRAAESAGFDYLQIHGSLGDELLSKVKLPVIKAFNVSDMDLYEYYEKRPEIAGFVFDSQTPGSGKAFDWNLLKTLPETDKFVLLAGGLHPDNVADAVRLLNPDGVDVSSGTEYEAGGKDPEKVMAFISNARKAEN